MISARPEFTHLVLKLNEGVEKACTAATGMSCDSIPPSS
jgi:hypothetical protein